MSPLEEPMGATLRAHWSLGDGSHLNHGSYGATPLVVQEEQSRLRAEAERHPDAFMARIKPDGTEQALRQAAGSVAMLCGTSAARLAFVENTTSGIQAVLNSLPLGSGDQVLITDHQYNAVRLAVEMRCRDTGATPVVVRIPLPTNAAEIMNRVLDAADRHVKLVILDHITSPTALVLPVHDLVSELRRRGVPVMVDGAHAIGQVPLSLEEMGADWYVTNLHKWLYAPRGTAVLHASAAAAPLTRPVITSHYVGLGFPRSFDYVGTRDYTAWLSAPRAVSFFGDLGPTRLWAHEAQLIARASRAVTAAGGMEIAPAGMSAAMRAFMLPQRRPATDADAATVIRALWEKERIQIRCARIGGTLLLRVCAQAYVAAEEMDRLGEALGRQGWPDRR